MSTPLNPSEIESALKELPDWQYADHALQKEFRFGNFREAISFIVRLSFYAEEFNHHPELFNVYNQVRLKLTTHDAGNQVTAKDLQLAKAIEDFAWR